MVARLHRTLSRADVSHKLKASESITVDGRLDEPAWLAAEPLQNAMVDITRHSDQQLNAVPMDLQADIKIRWDDDYFYVGATLHESYVTAQRVGHNPHAPYSPDNDFEIFIDVSGTTQYYVECMGPRRVPWPAQAALPETTRCIGFARRNR